MKINYLNIILYILAIGLLVFFIMIYGQPFLLMLLLPFLIIPVLDVLLFFSSYRNAVFTVVPNTASVELGNPGIFSLKYSTPSKFKFMVADLKLYIGNLFFPNNKLHNISLLITSANKSTKLPVENDSTGQLIVRIEETKLHDFLHFFTYVTKEKSEAGIPVLPKELERTFDIPMTPTSDGLEEFEESDLKGNISSDVKEIREYRPGDRLQRIHWKLSAKLDDLYVKEMAHTSILSLVVLPELNPDTINNTLETLRAITKELSKRDDRFEVCLYNNNTCEFEFIMVDDDTSMMNMFIKLYYLPLYEGSNTALMAYQASGQKASTIIHVTDKKFKIEDQSCQIF